ncbi:oxalate oxidase [Amylostereum chailletii]|nr:oxalate oxidase [Amylostereum chailletii]
MAKFSRALVAFILLAVSATSNAAPANTTANTNSTTPTTTDSAVPEYATVAPINQNANAPIYAVDDTNMASPQPIREGLGATILGPVNIPIELQNPDLFAPPSSDHGVVGNAKWPMSLSSNRLQTGGWARQQNVQVMPMATEMAGVNMRLEPGAFRELHWHTSAEWAYVMKGTTQVTSIDPEGRNYVANVGPGDLWYFPPGVPHSLQATADGEGTEFLLVFDTGDFDENGTLLLTDWMAHIPMDVLAKNFQTDPSAFDHIPSHELYIFPAAPPTDDKAVEDPQGQVQVPFSFPFSQVKPTPLSGGTVKIVDSTTFNASKTIAMAEVTVEPGAMRELHWHPTQDEWSFFLEGEARVTLFAGSGNARTYNFQAGDVGYVPASFGHYVENVGNSTLHFLEIFKTDRFQDISLSQWLAVTPPAIVKAHLGFDDTTIAHLNKTKQTVVGPSH